MIFVVFSLCIVIVLAPLALVLRGRGGLRSRRDSALAIHRAQLAELDRDLADGRIAPAEHANAVLEVQRRLLAAADIEDAPAPSATRTPVLATLVIVPLLGAVLYALDGHPFLPAAPLAARIAAAERQANDSQVLVAMLREKLATLDPRSDMARQGYVLLGNVEDSLGHLPQAAEAWRRALAIRFDPTLAALTAEAQVRLDGKVSPETAALFRRALAEGPPDAPWRTLAEQRLSDAGS